MKWVTSVLYSVFWFYTGNNNLSNTLIQSHKQVALLIFVVVGWHGGAVISTGFDPQVKFCPEFTCSPCTCMGSPKFSSFLPQSKDMGIGSSA